jgi:carbon-monoxide dehydrogenase medium subunit
VGVAAIVEVAGGKWGRVAIAIGGVTTKPFRATATEQALAGKAPDDPALAAAAETVRGSIHAPMSDLYASGEYRTHLAVVMTRRALALAAQRARG